MDKKWPKWTIENHLVVTCIAFITKILVLNLNENDEWKWLNHEKLRSKFHSTRIHGWWICHLKFEFVRKWMINFRMFSFFPSLHSTTLFGCCLLFTSIFYASFTFTHLFILDLCWNLILFMWFPWFLRVFLSSIFPIFSS